MSSVSTFTASSACNTAHDSWKSVHAENSARMRMLCKVSTTRMEILTYPRLQASCVRSLAKIEKVGWTETPLGIGTSDRIDARASRKRCQQGLFRALIERMPGAKTER